MKRNTILSCILLTVLLLGAISLLVYEKQSIFNGSRVKNPDGYTLEFTKMNQTDSHTLALQAGDSLTVDFAIDRGRVDLTVGIPGENPIYRGNDLDSAVFDLTIPKDGAYQIAVSAKHASGFVLIYAHRKSA